MKTQIIAVVSFLALLFSLNVSAHHDLSKLTDKQLDAKKHELFKELHKKKMKIVERILREEGVDEAVADRIIRKFKELKVKMAHCLLKCCKKHHEMMMEMRKDESTVESEEGAEEEGTSTSTSTTREAPTTPEEE